MDMGALLDEYERNHQSAVCRATHAVGIPLIALSIAMFPFRWRRALLLFTAGWILQFAGHAAEGKPPKFFEGSRYLLAGFLWWIRFASAPLRRGQSH